MTEVMYRKAEVLLYDSQNGTQRRGLFTLASWCFFHVEDEASSENWVLKKEAGSFYLVFKSQRDALLVDTQFQELVWKAELQKSVVLG